MKYERDGWTFPTLPKSADRLSGSLDKGTGITTHTAIATKSGKRWTLKLRTRMTSIGLLVKPVWAAKRARTT